jgi:hypothetical protein
MADSPQALVFAHAIDQMIKTLPRMEKSGKASADAQMDFVVWPILNEVQAKLKRIKEGKDPKLNDWPIEE